MQQSSSLNSDKRQISMKVKISIICLLCSILCFPYTAYAKTQTNPVRFACPWIIPAGCPKEDTVLAAKIIGEEPRTGRILQIFRDSKLIFSYDPKDLYADSLFVLNDGNLASLWQTGLGSYYHLFVFAYSNGKIHPVLHTVSDGLHPEFAYQSQGHIMGKLSEEKNGKWQLQGGPFFQQRIIVPNTEWIQPKKPYLGSRNADKQPVSADIYTWDEKTGKYKVRSKVPWSKRLQAL